jgi:hypothetical protein
MPKANRVIRLAILAVSLAASVWLLIGYSLPADVLAVIANLGVCGGLIYLTFSVLRADWDAKRPPPPSRNEDLAYLFGREYYERELAHRLPPDFNWEQLGQQEERRRAVNVAWIAVAAGLCILAAHYAWRVLG